MVYGPLLKVIRCKFKKIYSKKDWHMSKFQCYMAITTKNILVAIYLTVGFLVKYHVDKDYCNSLQDMSYFYTARRRANMKTTHSSQISIMIILLAKHSRVRRRLFNYGYKSERLNFVGNKLRPPLTSCEKITTTMACCICRTRFEL